MLGVLAERERVAVDRVVEEGQRARTDADVLGEVDDVLVDHRVAVAREGPRARGLELGCERLGDEPVVARLAVEVDVADGLGELAAPERGGHERVERRLVGLRRLHELDVAQQALLRLAREVEDHVDVERGELAGHRGESLEDLLAGAVLAVAVHLAQQAVVEALHAAREPLHASVEDVDEFVGEVVGAGLGRDLSDSREEPLGQVDRLGELVEDDGGRAAADVERGEVVTEVGDEAHLVAKVAEVLAGSVLLVEEPVERAVRAEPLAERHVRIEHVAVTGLGAGERVQVARRRRQIALVQHAECG